MIETLENEQQELQGSFKGSKALLDAREKYTMIDKQIQLREAKKQLKGHPKDKNFEVIVKALENEIKEHETLEAKKTELSSAAKDLSKEPEDKNLKERVENLREELKKLRGESPEATAASPDGGNLKKPKKSKKPKKPGRTER
ncbi:hypothetical protein BGZ60DRAFT_116204 [Tricladium varicosporioides]|nr:hypothetical protein BGZ60DRAFT_116204 [Hymenoscyphus varicosporioides]